MTPLLEALQRASATDRNAHRPVFFRPRVHAEKAALEDLLKREPRIQVFDELHSQLTELVRTLNPSRVFSKKERDIAALAHLNGSPAEEYGVWVYYPWSFRLVHLLDETEFALVRTDRNRNKITDAEQALLSTKRVGVIGLSVGQSICLTLALERSFGELRIADFDTLELSNLNRIRSGTQSMGHLKTVNVAREIAELDPFLKVTLFNEGLDRDNIERFCTEGGKLDILVDECDSVDVKIFCRQKARELRIPVLMDTSDRGMLDIERFDLEPDRPILHGLIEHLDPNDAAKAKTNEEKLQFVVPIIGLETMSTRMKASMLEIESSVVTWPQLASSVVMGGAIGGHVIRRIALGHDVPSGRWWLDPDELLGMAQEEASNNELDTAVSKLNIAPANLGLLEMIAAVERVPVGQKVGRLSQEDAERIAQAGSLAPSGGNCQPWKFLYHDQRLALFLDAERAHSSLDPGLRYAFFELGCCVENMLLEAARSGIELRQASFPLPDVPHLVTVLEPLSDTAPAGPDLQDRSLAERIALRCTNRKHSEVLDMRDSEVDALIDVVRTKHPLISLSMVRDEAAIDRIAMLCGRAERIRFLNPTCHHDMFVREMRWNSAETRHSKDGIDIETLELNLTDRTGLRIAADPRAMMLLRGWSAGHAMEKLAAKSIRASSALAIFSVPDLSLPGAFAGGRAVERFWLKASALGISAHPVGAPIFMGIHRNWDKDGILSAKEHEEAGAILKDLIKIIGVNGAYPLFMMRLGRAGEPTARSLRRPLTEMFHTTTFALA
ncbi:MAG: Rv1355c family protein [Flavobacteriales bacterium]